MAKRYFWVILILLVIFGGTFTWYAIKSIMTKQYFANFVQPSVTVSATIAKSQTWHPSLKSVGTLDAINGVYINSEVTGQVVKILFQSGQDVKEGDQLVQLDDSVDQQTLNNNLASLSLNTINYQRQLKLYKTRATPKSEVDKARAEMLQSKADVASARVMIGKKNIKAPFNGKLGIRMINLGEYIKPGQSMVLLQSLNPLYVNFSLPEQNLNDLKLDQVVRITTDAQKNKVFEGKLTAINSAVDLSTRSISVQATVPNDKNELYPGLFANVEVVLPVKNKVITVPQTAVTYSLYGDTIYVISKGKDKKGKPVLIAKQRFVRVGQRKGTVIAVTEGIKAGEQIVTSGQLKLHSGSYVVINNKMKLN